jgi:myo-inositol-1(or 4)-monophosphatase
MRELTFIEEFLRENAAYARDKFAARDGLTVTTKSDPTDLLTEVDLTLQKRATDRIRALYPGDVIVAEEGEFARMPKDPQARCWVMDPIDGTNNFVRGLFPIFGVSIAFAKGGQAVAGGVCLPGTGDLFLAERGAGAFRNGRRLQVSEVQSVSEARIDMDFSTVADRRGMVERGAALLCGAGQLRCHGSAVASICQIASGDIDAYVHMTLHPWDYAAAQLMVEEAGGMATRHDGTPLALFDGRKGVIISNGAIHEETRLMMGGG